MILILENKGCPTGHNCKASPNIAIVCGPFAENSNRLRSFLQLCHDRSHQPSHDRSHLPGHDRSHQLSHDRSYDQPSHDCSHLATNDRSHLANEN